mgnify:CR=1 FL=1|jgi:Phosphopantothenoylcysteine synthetase/decarboxylase
MAVVVTCGPAIAPIDGVRRITNFSTGTLGLTLANALAAGGREVVCFKGEAATTSLRPHEAVDVRPFSTNDDLLEKLRSIPTASAIFHAAALCDYETNVVQDESGGLRTEAKIPSRAGTLTLVLRPARKVLPLLREVFPDARIVGWKYELDGGREDALRAAIRQIQEARTDFCVVNGAAYGDGFGILSGDGTVRHFATTDELCRELVRIAV